MSPIPNYSNRAWLERSNYLLPMLLIASGGIYYVLGYQTIRSEVDWVWVWFGALFIGYGLVYRNTLTSSQYHLGILAAVLFRVLLLFALPNLSDDYFRFVWDGRLLINGISPYSVLPYDWIHGNLMPPPGIDVELYQQLNSPKYYTVYPPVCQWIFGAASALFPTNLYGAVVVMKLCLLLFELGTLYLMHRLATLWQLPNKRVLLYALNPLVVVEICGNLHFEGVMIFFLLLSVWWLFKGNKAGWSAVAMGLAVCSKLLPLMFLPLLVKRLGWVGALRYGIIMIAVITVCFTPFFSAQTFQGLAASVGLYFQKFEFNASIYYLIRALGYWVKGYNIIGTAGWILALTTTLVIVWLATTDNNFRQNAHTPVMLFSLFIYFALSTTVHPWYICTLVALCIFTPYRFAVLWSALVLLSYHVYDQNHYLENLWWTALEYVLVYVFLIRELLLYHRNP